MKITSVNYNYDKQKTSYKQNFEGLAFTTAEGKVIFKDKLNQCVPEFINSFRKLLAESNRVGETVITDGDTFVQTSAWRASTDDVVGKVFDGLRYSIGDGTKPETTKTVNELIAECPIQERVKSNKPWDWAFGQ